MDGAQRRHALTLNEAYTYYDDPAGEREREEYILRRDGIHRPDPRILEEMAQWHMRRAAEK
jgi:hypothetical protein